jgi:hypothetical protein
MLHCPAHHTVKQRTTRDTRRLLGFASGNGETGPKGGYYAGVNGENSVAGERPVCCLESGNTASR